MIYDWTAMNGAAEGDEVELKDLGFDLFRCHDDYQRWFSKTRLTREPN
jgi:hypothetical protein